MTQYKSLNPNSKWVMRINAVVTAIITAGVLFIVRMIIQNIEALDTFILQIADAIFIIILINLLLGIFLYPQIRFKRWKYAIDENRADIATGLITIKREIIPISRIQKIEIASGPIDRKFKLANIKILTAAGYAQIKFLAVEEAEEISIRLEKMLKDKLSEELKTEEVDLSLPEVQILSEDINKKERETNEQ